MRIHITSVDFDPQGRLTLDALPDSELGGLTRRVNRVPTLDLGVAVNDRGFSHGDRTFDIRWPGTAATNERAAYLTKTHGRVRVSTDEGVFDAIIETFEPGPRESAIRLLIVARLGP